MNISRRSFLRSVGTVIAGSLIIPDFRILLPFEKKLTNEVELFKIRKLVDYDIEWDSLIIRYDLMYDKRDGTQQRYFVASCIRIPDINMTTKEFQERYHKPMVTALKNQLKRDKVDYRRLKPLEMPPGYQEPAWFTNLLSGAVKEV